MSRTKGVVVEGRLEWVWSDTHDVVLALMVEAGEGVAFVPRAWIDDWRVCACVPDLAFSTAEAPTAADRATLRGVLERTRALARLRGDVTGAQVQSWVLGDDLVVCGGDLAVEPVACEQVLEVIDAWLGGGDVDADRAGALGAPGRAGVVSIRPEIVCLDAHGEIVCELVVSRETAQRPTAARDAEVVFAGARANAGEDLFLISPATDRGAAFRPLSDITIASIAAREKAAVVYVEDDRPGIVSARLLGAADRTSAALALAVLKAAWGWDESSPVAVTIDSEHFRVTTSYDGAAGQWKAVARARSASTTERPCDTRQGREVLGSVDRPAGKR